MALMNPYIRRVVLNNATRLSQLCCGEQVLLFGAVVWQRTDYHEFKNIWMHHDCQTDCVVRSHHVGIVHGMVAEENELDVGGLL